MVLDIETGVDPPNENDPFLDVNIIPEITQTTGALFSNQQDILITPEQYKALKDVLKDPENFNLFYVGAMRCLFLIRKKSILNLFIFFDVFLIPLTVVSCWVFVLNDSTHVHTESLYLTSALCALLHAFLEMIEFHLILHLLHLVQKQKVNTPVVNQIYHPNLKGKKRKKHDFQESLPVYLFFAWIGDLLLVAFVICAFLQYPLLGTFFGVLFFLCLTVTRGILCLYDLLGLLKYLMGVNSILESVFYLIWGLIWINGLFISIIFTSLV